VRPGHATAWCSRQTPPPPPWSVRLCRRARIESCVLESFVSSHSLVLRRRRAPLGTLRWAREGDGRTPSLRTNDDSDLCVADAVVATGPAGVARPLAGEDQRTDNTRSFRILMGLSTALLISIS